MEPVWKNQNCCSLTICASRMAAALEAGAVAVTLMVADWPGARSFGSAYRWSVSQAAEPARSAGAKWRPRRTGYGPADGQVWLPLLVTVTVKFWVCP